MPAPVAGLVIGGAGFAALVTMGYGFAAPNGNVGEVLDLPVARITAASCSGGELSPASHRRQSNLNTGTAQRRIRARTETGAGRVLQDSPHW